jgi:hypothetical protein
MDFPAAATDSLAPRKLQVLWLAMTWADSLLSGGFTPGALGVCPDFCESPEAYFRNRSDPFFITDDW